MKIILQNSYIIGDAMRCLSIIHCVSNKKLCYCKDDRAMPAI